MQNNLIMEFGVLRHKTSIIRNPINISSVRKQAGFRSKQCNYGEKKQLISVGTLDPRKNFDGLIRSFSLCDSRDLSLRIIGDGPERQNLETLVGAYGLSSRIELLGHVDNPYPLILQADALVLSSIYEGLPNVVLEALALRTSVISTPAGGVCAELLANRHGCFVAKDHSDSAIAHAINDWFRNEPYKIADDVIKEFDAENVVHIFENKFERLLR